MLEVELTGQRNGSIAETATIPPPSVAASMCFRRTAIGSGAYRFTALYLVVIVIINVSI